MMGALQTVTPSRVDKPFMDIVTLAQLACLIRGRRVGALATLQPEGEPMASMIAFAPEPDFSGFILLASGLAQHTRNFHRDPRVALMIAEADDDPAGDPQTLARLSVLGTIGPHPAESLATARAVYLERFPSAERLFSLGDFRLYRLSVRSARFVAGFARTFDLVPSHLRQAARTVAPS